MRFEAIGLLRYGHFSDRHLRFLAEEGRDFQLILGRNEAGKSTLRQAFHDLLFGIPMDTAMSFLHPGTELELSACLSGPPGHLVFGRKRKRNGGLVDAEGELLPPEALRPWLGDVNEAFYERMFGLDHRRLEQGGRAMLQASDNVDSVLFQAAAGVSALNDVLAALREEAATLWAPRRSRDRAWYVAAARLADAETVLRAATVRPSAWAEAQRESRRLEEAFGRAEAEHADLLARVRELERLRRVAPLLAQIRQYEAVRGGHDAPLAVGPHKEYEADIVRLEEMRLRVADHPVGVEHCVSRIDLLWRQLAQVLRELGRPVPAAGASALDDLAAGLPARPVRREIEHLVGEGRQARAQSRAAARALAERRAEFERLRDEMAALPRVAVGASLRQALDAVSAAGDIEARVEAARQARRNEEAAVRRRLESMAQPGVVSPADMVQAIQWLADMTPWPTGRLLEQTQRRQGLQVEIDTLAKRLREAELDCDQAALELEQFRRAHQAVVRDDIVRARRERDALWGALARGEAALDAQAERYAGLVLNADTLADRHLEAVGDAARLQALRHEHERRERAMRGLRQAHADALAVLAGHDEQWARACEARGLPALQPADLQGWQLDRDAVLAAHERRREAGDALQALEARRDMLLTGLLEALAAEDEANGISLLAESREGQAAATVSARAGAPAASAATPVDVPAAASTPAPAALSLAASRERANALLRRAQQAQARREALAEHAARIEPLLPVLEEECRRHEADEAEWNRRWHEALARAGLPRASQPAYVEAALALLADADELAGQLREAYAQRERMQTELRNFGEAARRMAEALHDVAFDAQAPDMHVRRWVAEVGQARQLERTREDARQRLAELNERLLHEGEGRSRQAIEAELEAVDVAGFASRAEALASALEEAAAARSALAVECEQARKALEAISGGDAAAVAEARRQEALADMAEVAERYVRLQAEYRLLERVAERYRERRQGPLLARAGQVFAGLTLGAHAGLVVDTEAASLHARRADGGLVPLDGLSDGTRDQLYLALRLAALELYLDHAPPMPFIADDLFVNYDDRRAVAGLRSLGGLARRTQVVFLTHHAHMVELAREALGEPVRVIEL